MSNPNPNPNPIPPIPTPIPNPNSNLNPNPISGLILCTLPWWGLFTYNTPILGSGLGLG